MERGTAKLFARYERLDQQIKMLEERIRRLREKQSETVRSIFSTAGSGPFVWKKHRVQVARIGHTFILRRYGQRRS